MDKKLNEDGLIGAKIKAIPKSDPEIGVDTTGSLETNILEAAINSILDVGKLEGFSAVAQTREQVYRILDSMGNDSTIAAILETYAEDTVETNDDGRIMWCESSNTDVANYVTYLLDSINVDKYLYGWAHSLIKYGDLYLRLYRESDIKEDELFGKESTKKVLTEDIDETDDEHVNITEFIASENKKDSLKEEVNVITRKKDDNYIHYIEAVSNPGEMFELTRFGKTVGYVEAPISIQQNNINKMGSNFSMQYKMRRGDVNIYGATEFVHATLEDTSSRQPEEVNIFLTDEDSPPLTYKVRRGQSILYNNFKVWRELSLLENSVLLNRVTKSSIFRIIQVEVGDMPKEQIGTHLARIKSLMEQKAAIDSGAGMQEYNNAGPVENKIYVPTHNGIGAITTSQIGGDVDPKQLTDIKHYQDKLFGGFRAVKQFFGITDDSAGFNGGSSLAIISSRYGKAVKRYKNTLIQAITDAVNLMLLDKGLYDYVNKFTLKMTAPTTQEEVEKRDGIASKIRNVSDVMNLLSDIQDSITKLKILKKLLSSTLTDPEVLTYIQDEIDKLEADEDDDNESSKEKAEETEDEPKDTNTSFEDKVFGEDEPEIQSAEEPEDVEGPETEDSDEDNYLPSPSELGLDLTQND